MSDTNGHVKNSMNIGVKIILGFTALIVILACLVGYLAFQLFSIDRRVDALSIDTIPMIRSAAGLERALSAMSLQLRGYSYSEDAGMLETAKSEIPFAEKNLSDIKANLADFDSPGHAEISAGAADIEKLRAEFLDMVGSLEKHTKEVIEYRDKFSLEQAQAFAKISQIYDMIKAEVAAAALDNGDGENEDGVADQKTTQLAEKINEAMDIVDQLWDSSENSRLLFWEGQARRDTKLLYDANNQLEKAKALASSLNEMLGDQKEYREILDALLKEVPEAQTSCAQFIKSWELKANDDQTGMKVIAGFMGTTAKIAELSENGGSEMTNTIRGAVGSARLSAFIGLGLTILVGITCAFVINRTVTGSIKRAVDNLLRGANSVDMNSDTLAEAAHTLSTGASENAASLEETSAAVEELNSMTARNAENASQANTLMSNARQGVERANGSMAKVTTAMEEISTSGQEIGKIIKTIDEIAFQTNLLALNAAVEAARAGEAGAGFAVVADEVRNLAIRAAEAAKNTADLIESTISNINSGSELVQVTRDYFNEVGGEVNKVSLLLSEVAEASKEQSTGISQISTAMVEMEQVTQSNASAAEESDAAAKTLADQAIHLMETVSELGGMVYSIAQMDQLTRSVKAEASRSAHQQRQLPAA